MQSDMLLLLIVVIIGFGVLAYVIISLSKRNGEKDSTSAVIEWLRTMQRTLDVQNRILTESMRGTTTDVTRAMQENTRQLNERLDTAAKYIGDLKRGIGEMSEMGRGIRDLNEFLQSPKIRGNLGEAVLGEMLAQAFPKQVYQLQHRFRSQAKVDAVVKTGLGLLCIDAKFPMSNFQLMMRGETETERKSARKEFLSDVKGHINDIAKKYILPEEGTADFALMYIPSESVYYEVATTEDIMTVARTTRVYPVSPNTLHAHLQLILVSFQGRELEQKSREVFRLLKAIHKDYTRIDEQLGIVNRHVVNAYNAVNILTTGVASLGSKIQGSTNLGIGITEPHHTKDDE